MKRGSVTPLLLAALTLAACNSGGSTSSDVPALGTTRGAITLVSGGSVTVNGVQLSTQGAVVRRDGQPASEDSLRKGMVVTVKGGFDDRVGHANEIEIEHGIEGQVDDKGTDFVVVGGQMIHVDDSTEFGEDNPLRLGSVGVGKVIAVSGVPDDKGGLRASRIDDSPRNTGAADVRDDFDVKGFVSNASGSSFQLRLSPDASSWYVVDAAGLALPANGSYVEVHSATRPAPGGGNVLGTITATSIHLEDRFDESGEIEIEGIVTSIAGSRFVVDGTMVETDGSTRFELGASGDLVPGAKVEAEGHMDAQGVLHAEKVSFRAGVRVAATIQNLSFSGGSGTMTLLGVPVQLPSFADFNVALANGARVEVRGNPSADGTGIVAQRVDANSSGNVDRVFIRALVTAKSDASAPTFTVLGFTITTAGASFNDVNDAAMSRADFFAAVEPGRTVVKARAASAANVSGSTFAAEEIELEGNE